MIRQKKHYTYVELSKTFLHQNLNFFIHKKNLNSFSISLSQAFKGFAIYQKFYVWMMMSIYMFGRYTNLPLFVHLCTMYTKSFKATMMNLYISGLD